MKKRLRLFALLLMAGLVLFGLASCEDKSSDFAGTIKTVSYSEPAGGEVAVSFLSEASLEEENRYSASAAKSTKTQAAETTADEELLDRDGTYTTKEDVALYLCTYGELPSNFITKKQARELGWSGGSLEPYAPGKCIGGDRFGNYEGSLPKGRTYHECDINTLGAKSRGAERLVFSDDGLIYYTEDHYETFTLLYGEE